MHTHKKNCSSRVAFFTSKKKRRSEEEREKYEEGKKIQVVKRNKSNLSSLSFLLLSFLSNKRLVPIFTHDPLTDFHSKKDVFYRHETTCETPIKHRQILFNFLIGEKLLKFSTSSRFNLYYWNIVTDYGSVKVPLSIIIVSLMNVALSSYFTPFPDCRHVIMRKYPYEYIVRSTKYTIVASNCDNNRDCLSIIPLMEQKIS